MKLKKVLAVGLVATMTASLAGCGASASKDSSSSKDSSAASTEASSSAKELSYANIELGKSYTDVKATIKFFNCRTDLSQKDYNGKNWDAYVADFNKMYPNIKVEVETDTNYAADALTRLQGGDWGDIMMIPAVDKKDLSTYFLPYGDLDTMKQQVNYATAWEYQKQVYGIACDGTAQGLVYNKKVFEAAGITTLPKTPDEFITDLQAIKDKTDAIPLYTNYAAGWTMGAWDSYIGAVATGDNTYMNQKLVHTANPFKDYGDNTHANAVYKVLYDAVSKKLIEDDYSTTDWEGSKTMMNAGKIGVMALGSWAYPQMQLAGSNADDIGYMAFPITVNGKQYTVSGADYCYGINKDASKENQEASMVFVKWLTEKSGYAYNEAGLPVAKDLTDTKLDFQGVEIVEDEPALTGEEDLLNKMNSTSELNVNNGGNDKIQAIVEHAATGDESFEDLMNEWNQKWSDAQSSNSVKVEY